MAKKDNRREIKRIIKAVEERDILLRNAGIQILKAFKSKQTGKTSDQGREQQTRTP